MRLFFFLLLFFGRGDGKGVVHLKWVEMGAFEAAGCVVCDPAKPGPAVLLPSLSDGGDGAISGGCQGQIRAARG